MWLLPLLALVVVALLLMNPKAQSYTPVPTISMVPLPVPLPYVTGSPGDIERQLGELKSTAAYGTLLHLSDHTVRLNITLKSGPPARFQIKFPTAAAANNAIERWSRKLAPVPLKAA